MPFDWLGQWIDEPAAQGQQGQAGGMGQAEQTIMTGIAAHMAAAGQAQQAAQEHAQHLAAAQQHAQNTRMYQTLGAINYGTATAGYATTGENAYTGHFRARRRTAIDAIVQLDIDGLKEVVVDRQTYDRMCLELNVTTVGLSLQIATSYGRIIVRPEGGPTGEQINFDRYMEDVDGRLP